VRPECVRLIHGDDGPGALGAGTVEHAAYMGTHQELRVVLDKGLTVDARVINQPTLAKGERVAVAWRPEDATLLPA
jgi:hypothetical protein